MDFIWLLHRAAQLAGNALNGAAVAAGLESARDFIVISELCRGEPRTQLALGQAVGLDKTTLTAVLDRLEKAGWVVRRIDPHNRRAKFPEITDAGRELEKKLTAVHAEVEARLLEGLSAEQSAAVKQALALIVRSAEAQCGAVVKGSCV